MDWNAPELRTDFRYVVVDRTTWGEVREVTDITGGNITRKYLSELKDAASLNYSDTAQLLTIGEDYVRVYLDATGPDGVTESVALGTFKVSTPSQNVSDHGTSGSATCYSVLQVLQGEGLAETVTIPAGEPLIAYAAGIVSARGLNVDVQSETTATCTSDAVFTTDRNYLDVVIWCSQAAGFGTPSVDGYGTVVFRKYEDPAGKSPIREYGPGSLVMFPTYDHEFDTYDFPNKVIVTCSTPESCVIGIAVNDDPDHPYSTVNRGRVVTATYDQDNLEDQAAADARAAVLLSQVSAVESVTVSHLYDGSALQDVVSVAGLGDFSIVEQDISLSPGCPVDDRARRFVF